MLEFKYIHKESDPKQLERIEMSSPMPFNLSLDVTEHIYHNIAAVDNLMAVYENNSQLPLIEEENKKLVKLSPKKLLKLSPKQVSVDQVFQPDENGFSDWIARAIIQANPNLNWGKNGVQRHGVFFADKRYVWEKYPKTGTITHLKLSGFNPDVEVNTTRPIRDEIHAYHKSMGCVVCGSHSSLVTDHKNDLYNDQRVLNAETQTIDDFQCLCTHCNLQKREVAVKTKASGKRYKATNIPQLAVFGIDFIEGDEFLDFKNPNAMVGTFWHDPLAFMNYIKNNM